MIAVCCLNNEINLGLLRGRVLCALSEPETCTVASINRLSSATVSSGCSENGCGGGGAIASDDAYSWMTDNIEEKFGPVV